MAAAARAARAPARLPRVRVARRPPGRKERSPAFQTGSGQTVLCYTSVINPYILPYICLCNLTVLSWRRDLLSRDLLLVGVSAARASRSAQRTRSLASRIARVESHKVHPLSVSWHSCDAGALAIATRVHGVCRALMCA